MYQSVGVLICRSKFSEMKSGVWQNKLSCQNINNSSQGRNRGAHFFCMYILLDFVFFGELDGLSVHIPEAPTNSGIKLLRNTQTQSAKLDKGEAINGLSLRVVFLNFSGLSFWL